MSARPTLATAQTKVVPAPISAAAAPRTLADRRRGLRLGLGGVVAFSGTLPAARPAVAFFDPIFVGLGRAVVAALLAAPVPMATRTPMPQPGLRPRRALVAAGVVVARRA